jgi:hypothetical protein
MSVSPRAKTLMLLALGGVVGYGVRWMVSPLTGLTTCPDGTRPSTSTSGPAAALLTVGDFVTTARPTLTRLSHGAPPTPMDIASLVRAF